MSGVPSLGPCLARPRKRAQVSPAGLSLGDRSPRAPGELVFVAHRHHSSNMGAECGARWGSGPVALPLACLSSSSTEASSSTALPTFPPQTISRGPELVGGWGEGRD